MSENGLPSLLERHWAESALAIGAVIIAAVSLWVAYDTERTNRDLVASERQLVAANSWPFVQVGENDQAPGGGPGLSLIMYNGGIGPAKVETFELFWKGKPQHNPFELLHACCASPKRDIGVSTPSGVVLRPGQLISFLFFNRTPENGPLLDALRAGMNNISLRYCYCSAFDECWVGIDQFGQPRDLHPPQVSMCPKAAVPYTNHGT
jgi:hypothetical protein